MYNCSVAGVQSSPTALFSHMRRGCSTTNGLGVQPGRYIHRSLITVPEELRRAYPNVQPEYMQKALERCREQPCPEDETTIGWFGKILAAVLIDEAIGKWGEKHEHP